MKEIKTLEEKTNNADFWQDSQNSSKILKQINQIKSKIEFYKKIENNLNSVIEMNSLLEQEKEDSLEEELKKSIKQLEKEIEKLEIDTLLSGKYDSNNAILTIHPGAGGTESCDWALMLSRMYTKYFDKKKYKYEVLSEQKGDETGIKSIVYLVKGKFCYG